MGHALSRDRIDKAYCNILLRECFPETFVRNLPRTKYDHRPIIITLDPS